MFTIMRRNNPVVLAIIIFLIGCGTMVLSGRAAEAAPKIALAANNGERHPYMNSDLKPNDNLLWRLERDGDYVRILPKIENVALDADGGKDKPYLNSHLEQNDNLLWKLEKHGEYYMIHPKVNLKVALDAHGGKGSPYLSTEPNPDNVNHLWMLVKEGDFYKIFTKVGASE